jgi:hypothetical protein
MCGPSFAIALAIDGNIGSNLGYPGLATIIQHFAINAFDSVFKNLAPHLSHIVDSRTTPVSASVDESHDQIKLTFWEFTAPIIEMSITGYTGAASKNDDNALA